MDEDQLHPLVSAIFETLGQFVASAAEKIEALQAASELCTAGLEVEAELAPTGQFVSVGVGMMRISDRVSPTGWGGAGNRGPQPGFYGGRERD